VEERKKKIIAGGLTIVVLAFFCGLYWQNHKAATKEGSLSTQEYTIGVIDLKQAMQAHPKYQELVKLRKERNILAAAAAVKTEFNITNPPPVIDAQTFDDSIKQKSSQKIEENKSKLDQMISTQKKNLTVSMAAQRETDLEAVREKYRNDIFNLQLQYIKYDNLKPNREATQQIDAAIEAEKQKRNQELNAVNAQYDNNIQHSLHSFIEQKSKEQQVFTANLLQQLQQEAAVNRQQAQSRDDQAMKDLTIPFSVDDVMQKNEAINNKDKEITVLEDLINKDIAGIAAKIALTNHLECVFANVEVNIHALDITDDVMKEFKTANQTQENE
jgi:hypothetical protein